MQPPRLSIWERQERPPLPESDMEENEMEIDRGHAVSLSQNQFKTAVIIVPCVMP